MQRIILFNPRPKRRSVMKDELKKLVKTIVGWVTYVTWTIVCLVWFPYLAIAGGRLDNEETTICIVLGVLLFIMWGFITYTTLEAQIDKDEEDTEAPNET
jgi:hypothetical protein